MKKGFTLAEVLITLAIIGVVASLTIPSIISNTNKQEYKSSLKKAVSVLNQALQLRYATNNDSPFVAGQIGSVVGMLSSQMNTVAVNGKYNGARITTGVNCSVEDVADKTKASTIANSGCYMATTDGMQFWFPETVDDYICSCTNLDESLFGDSCSRYKPEYNEATDSCPESPPDATFRKTKINAQATLTDKVGCTNDNPCYLIVDVNGDKKPNILTKSSDDLQDRYLLKIGDNKNSITVLPANDTVKDIMQK